MPNEFKIKNGAIVNGTISAGQTGFNASGIFSGDTIGAILLSTTGSTGFAVLTIGGTFSIYDNTNAATRFYMGSGGDIGIGTSSPGAKLHLDGSIRIDNQTGTPGGTNPVGAALNEYYGGASSGGSIYLSDPTTWLKINIDGTAYYIPAYI